MKLSVCYILKDCADTIVKSLESVSGAYECICVDTGSKDDTIGIAQSFANVKLYHFDWVDDFSKARNYSIEQATGDYILILDGDEYLEEGGIEKINKAMESGKEIMTMIQWNFLENENHMQCKHFRLFKNKLGIKYINRSHEILTDAGHTKGDTDIILYHTGYDFKNEQAKQDKTERNIKLHLRQLVEEPHNKEVKYNLTRAYGNLQRWKEVIEYGTLALLFDGLDNDKRSQLSYMLFMAWNQFERGTTAMYYLNHSLKLIPNQRRSRLAMANCFHQKEMFEEAILELQKMKNIKSDLTADLEYPDEFIDSLIQKVEATKKEYQLIKRRA